MKSLIARIAIAGAVIAELLLPIGVVHAASVTWTGDAGNGLMSDVGNWSGGVAPVDGDTVIFPSTATSGHRTVNNDISNLSLANINFTGVYGGSDTTGYVLYGNALTLTNGIDDQVTNSVMLNLDITLGASASISATYSGANGLKGNLTIGSFVDARTFALAGHNLILATTASASIINMASTLSGNGNVTMNGAGAFDVDKTNSFVGDVIVNGGSLYARTNSSLGDVSNTVSINTGADIHFGSCDDTSTLVTYPYSMTLTGLSSLPTGLSPTGKLSFGVDGCSGGGTGTGVYEPYGSRTGNGTQYALSGAIVLGSDITVGGIATQATLSGALSGAHSFSVLPHDAVKLIVGGSSNTTSTPNGTLVAPSQTATISDDQSTYDTAVLRNAIVTLDGNRGTVNVWGVLKGNGTVAGLLTVASGGTVAPGHSPGCITSNGLTMVGTYQVEIGGTTVCTEYDQLKSTSGTVNVSNGTIDVVLVNGYAPKGGETFVIIDNGGSSPVSGTLTGLAEGATVTVGASSFTISYTGGDGNDVVLTAVAKAPDTGVHGLRNPALPIGLGLSLAIVLALGWLELRRRTMSGQ